MVETRYILPPEDGPQSNPLLYGVAEALACLFPIDDRQRPCAGSASDSAIQPEPAPEAAAPAEQAVVRA